MNTFTQFIDPFSRPPPLPLQMIKMMVTVVIVFTVCWLPFNILVVMNRNHFIKLLVLLFTLHDLIVLPTTL